MSSAEQTVNDVRGFCQRNPGVCEDARISLTLMLSRLKNGAELIQTWLVQEDSSKEDGTGGSQAQEVAPADTRPPAPIQTPRLVPKWQDSLNPADKQFPWRGPAHL